MSKLFSINSKRSFGVVNKTATTAEITIYADIGGWWDDTFSAKKLADILNGLPSTVNEITVRLNSPGGDVFDGVAIYNRLKQHKAKIIVYIDGYAASIASIIALAGDEVIMSEGALMMVHKPWTWKAGNSLEFEQTINLLDDIEEQMVGIYQRKTKLDRAEIKTMLANETWLNADQALEKGFITRKMVSDEKIDMAACLGRAEWIRNKPQVESSNDIIRNEVNNLRKSVEDFLARSKA